MYDEERKMATMGPAKVVLLHPGSFKELQNYILENSASNGMQFKMPRKLRRKEWIQVLLNNLNGWKRSQIDNNKDMDMLECKLNLTLSYVRLGTRTQTTTTTDDIRQSTTLAWISSLRYIMPTKLSTFSWS